MAFADTAEASEGKRATGSRPDIDDRVKPFPHQVRRYIGKSIARERCLGVCVEVTNVLKRTDLNDVFNFFVDSLHLCKTGTLQSSSGLYFNKFYRPREQISSIPGKNHVIY